uniref:Meckelin n=1 Tax=Parastrongyloides trichosuri TaxID=131310 RepID=A0A0N5A3H0_PARTI
MECQKCDERNNSKIGISYDGLECVNCYDKNNSLVDPNPKSGKCPMCEIGFMPFLDRRSNPIKELCIPCPKNEDTVFETCRICKFGECYIPLTNETSEIEKSSTIHSLTNINIKYLNNYIMENIMEATYFCEKGFKKECNHLANMCVLQNYAITNEHNNACIRLQNIIRENVYTWKEFIPAIVSQFGEATLELNRENAIEERFSFDEGHLNSKLNIIANIFSLNGTFLGQRPMKTVDVQLCTGLIDDTNGYIIFGKQYNYKCILSYEDMELKIPNLFYELYLEVNNKNNISLYPIFIVNQGIYTNSKVMKQQNYISSDWVLSRRFYTYETTLSYKNTSTIEYRYMNYFKLFVRIQEGKNGKIWPLYAIISFNEVKNEDKNNYQEHTFSVFYTEKEQDDNTSIDIILAILCTISLLWAAVRAYSWSKRSGRMIADISTMIQLILCECDNVSNIFLIVITITSVWWTFSYKAQKSITFVLPMNENSFHYKNYIFLAFILKCVALIQRYSQLILSDTFFIDWEKPKEEENNEGNNFKSNSHSNSNILNKKVNIRKAGIWRTYLVANEWNELQNYRKINIALQLLTTILIFESLNFKRLTAVEPGFHLTNDPLEVNYYSTIFRYSVISIIYFCSLLFQWAIRVFILEPVIDPFHNFIDLCSIANISVLSLTHALHGYYIHGRSPHGYADTNMQEINKFLQMEKNNQCGFRGLENGSDLQTYIITMPKMFRDKFLKIQGSLRQNNDIRIKMRNESATTEKVENQSKVYDELNSFLRHVIEHDDMECDYDIAQMKIMEDITDMEFVDTTTRGIFYKDTSEIAFTRAFIYGNEWINCTFEFCFFSVMDFYFQNLLISAFLTYLLVQLIKKISSMFFTSHLIKSSLIDHRFLI